MRNLSKEARVALVQPPIAAGVAGGSTTQDHVVMNEFDSVAFVASLGTHGSTCLAVLKAQGSTSSTAWFDISGATISSTKNADDKCLLLDVVRPIYRYIRPHVTRSSTAGGSEFGGVLALQYGAKHRPVTQATTTQAATPVLWTST